MTTKKKTKKKSTKAKPQAPKRAETEWAEQLEEIITMGKELLAKSAAVHWDKMSDSFKKKLRRLGVKLPK